MSIQGFSSFLCRYIFVPKNSLPDFQFDSLKPMHALVNFCETILICQFMPRYKPWVPYLSNWTSLKICEMAIACGMRCVVTKTNIAHEIYIGYRGQSVLSPAGKEPWIGPTVDLARMLLRKYFSPIRLFLVGIGKHAQIFGC